MIKAMKQALAALEYPGPSWPESREKTAQALRQAIEHAEKQEPAAWMYADDLERFETSETFAQAYSIEMVSPTQGETVPLYTAPQAQPCPYIVSTREGTHHCALSQRPWVSLTDAEIEEFDYYARDLVMDIEKALKERNT